MSDGPDCDTDSTFQVTGSDCHAHFSSSILLLRLLAANSSTLYTNDYYTQKAKQYYTIIAILRHYTCLSAVSRVICVCAS